MFHTSDVTTLSGRQLLLVDHHPDDRQVVLVGDLDHAGPLGEQDVGTLGDLRLGGLGRRRRVEERVDERHVDRGVGVRLADAHDEGVDDAVDLGDRHRRDDADRARLGEPAGEHPGEVAGVLQPVVEHAEVGRLLLEPGAEGEGRVRIVSGDGPHRLLGGEGVADDDVRVVGLDDVAQAALHLIGGPEPVDPLVLDRSALGDGLDRGVDRPVPRLLQRRGEHAVDEQRLSPLGCRRRLGDRAARRRCKGGGRRRPHCPPSESAHVRPPQSLCQCTRRLWSPMLAQNGDVCSGQRGALVVTEARTMWSLTSPHACIRA